MKNIKDLIGSNFNDRLTGNNKENVIEGGAGKDILSGGGASDIFVFGKNNGSDTINDFDSVGADHDVIDLQDAVGIRSLKDLFANHLKASGDDLVIRDDSGGQIRRLDTDRSEVVKSDFSL